MDQWYLCSYKLEGKYWTHTHTHANVSEQGRCHHNGLMSKELQGEYSGAGYTYRSVRARQEKGRCRKRGEDGRINCIHRPWVVQSPVLRCATRYAHFPHWAYLNFALYFFNSSKKKKKKKKHTRILRQQRDTDKFSSNATTIQCVHLMASSSLSPQQWSSLLLCILITLHLLPPGGHKELSLFSSRSDFPKNLTDSHYQKRKSSICR